MPAELLGEDKTPIGYAGDPQSGLKHCPLRSRPMNPHSWTRWFVFGSLGKPESRIPINPI